MRALALGLLVLCFGAACVMGSPAPRDRYYRLEVGAPAGAPPKPRFSGSLRVEPLRADGLTRGTALLLSDPSQPARVERRSYHHWVSPPTEMIQVELARFLAEAGVAERVLPAGHPGAADHVVGGRIVRLEQVVGSQPAVVLELALDVTRDADRAVVFQKRYREARPAPSEVDAAAAALGEALDAVLRRFLADLAGS